MYSCVYLSNNNNAAQFCTGLGYAGASYPCLQTPPSTYYGFGSSQQLNNAVANQALFLPFLLSPATPALISSASSPISFYLYNSVNYLYTLVNTSTTTYYFNFSSQF